MHERWYKVIAGVASARTDYTEQDDAEYECLEIKLETYANIQPHRPRPSQPIVQMPHPCSLREVQAA